MENVCSQHSTHIAKWVCYCSVPLTYICKKCAEKHPMHIGPFEHFHLPMSVAQKINTEAAHERCREWLLNLHTAQTALKKCEEEVERFEAQLQTVKTQLIAQIEGEVSAVKLITDELKHSIQHAISETCDHALDEGWGPGWDSLSYFIWYFDTSDDSSCPLLNCRVQREREANLLQVEISAMHSSLSKFSYSSQACNCFDSERYQRSLEEDNQAIREQLASAMKSNNELRKQVEDLKNRLAVKVAASPRSLGAAVRLPEVPDARVVSNGSATMYHLTSNDVREFSCRDLQWSPTIALHRIIACDEGTSYYIDGTTIYFVGNCRSRGQEVGRIICRDNTCWIEELPSMKTAKSRVGLGLTNRELFIFGGVPNNPEMANSQWSLIRGDYLKSIEVLKPSEGSCVSLMERMKEGRCSFTPTFHISKFYLCGPTCIEAFTPKARTIEPFVIHLQYEEYEYFGLVSVMSDDELVVITKDRLYRGSPNNWQETVRVMEHSKVVIDPRSNATLSGGFVCWVTGGVCMRRSIWQPGEIEIYSLS